MGIAQNTYNKIMSVRIPMSIKISLFILARFLIPIGAVIMQIQFPNTNPLWYGIGEIVLDFEPYMGEILDKTGDTFSNSCLLIIAGLYCRNNYHESWLMPVLISLFLWRHLIGYILYLIYENRKLFLFFPNVFQVVYLVHFTFVEIYSKTKFDKKWIEYLCIGIFTALKLLQEYIFHYLCDGNTCHFDVISSGRGLKLGHHTLSI